jgi:V/A-type H+-transporting ATPase subunit I
MSEEKINKVFVLAHQKHRDEIVSSLQKFGEMQVDSILPRLSEEDWAKVLKESPFPEDIELENKIAKLKHCISFFNVVKPVQKNPMENFVDLGRREPVPRERLRKYIQEVEGHLDEINNKVRELNTRHSDFVAQRAVMSELKRAMRRYELFDIDFSKIADTGKVRFFFGSVKKQDHAKLEKPGLHFEKLDEKKDKLTGVAAVLKEPDAEKAFAESGFTSIPVPQTHGLTGTPKEILRKADEKIKEADEGVVAVDKESKKLTDEWQLKMWAVFDYLSLSKSRGDILNSSGWTDHTIVVEGWVQEKDSEEFKRVVSNASDGSAHVVLREAKEGENAPIILRNSPLLRPFEVVTRTFAFPKYKEVDPTLVLAPFFLVFIGLCVTDAGYGVTLAALGLILRWKYPELRGFFTLIFFAGLSTIVWGALMGGWFGGLVPMNPIWFDSLKNPINFLILALLLGVLQICFGIIVSFVDKLRRGEYFSAFADRLTWLFLVLGMFSMVLATYDVIPLAFKDIPLYVSVGAAGALVLTQGRNQKSIVMKFLGGLTSLYAIVGYLSDTLSYARLLALGLATSAVAMVVNTLAGMAYSSIGIIGIILAIPVLILGHFANLLISTLGAYIHTSRLQYVEFFSKFYEGGGRKFRPFRADTTYTEIDSEV